MRVPEHLLERPYLQPLYDDPEFIVRNVWRLYGAGTTATRRPQARPRATLAAELADLAGGPGVLADRASELAETGDLRLAGHLAQLAAQAAPADAGVQAVRATVYRARRQAEPSLMAKGVFGWAARDAEARAEG